MTGSIERAKTGLLRNRSIMDSSQGRGERSADGAQWSGLEWEKWKTGRNPNRPMTMGRTSDRKPSWGRETRAGDNTGRIGYWESAGRGECGAGRGGRRYAGEAGMLDL